MDGSVFKNYTIDREVGKGGMATIYRARDNQTGRIVALKFLLPHIATNDSFVRQFMEEFRANQFLRHQNIVETIEGGEADGRWYIAMEFLDGGSLKELVKTRPRIPVDLAVHVTINVLKGLQHSHHAGIVHQDMKPANVMVQQDGSIKIADFGISRIASPALWTPTGKIKGTPAYMAPEQAAGKEPTYKWDIFSTGVMFYELLAGFNPFGSKDPQEALKKITSEDPPPLVRALPTISYDLEVVVRRMLEKDPDRRYANVDTILNDLHRVTQRLQLYYSQEVFRDWVIDPDRMGGALTSRRAAFFLETGRRMVAAGKSMADIGTWMVYLAALTDPSNGEARQLLHDAARDHGFTLKPSQTMDIKALEAKLKEHPDDMKSLLQLARLYRVESSILQTFYFARTALSLAPLDPSIAQQVEKLLGPGKLQYL